MAEDEEVVEEEAPPKPSKTKARAAESVALTEGKRREIGRKLGLNAQQQHVIPDAELLRRLETAG